MAIGSLLRTQMALERTSTVESLSAPTKPSPEPVFEDGNDLRGFFRLVTPTDTEFDTDKSRWFRQRKDPQVALDRWADHAHCLYCTAWAVVLGCLLCWTTSSDRTTGMRSRETSTADSKARQMVELSLPSQSSDPKPSTGWTVSCVAISVSLFAAGIVADFRRRWFEERLSQAPY